MSLKKLSKISESPGKHESKQEPIFMVNEKINPCNKCGFEFTKDDLASCKVKNEQCRSCGIKGNFARMCRTVKSDISRGRERNINRARMERVNLIRQEDGQSETGSENDEDKMVLHLNGSGNQPFIMKAENTKSFTAMMDSVSLLVTRLVPISFPITIFTQADLRKILRVDVIFARPMPRSEQYVDYNNQPLHLVESITAEVQMGRRRKKIKNARIVITRDRKRSVTGRDWLAQLYFRVGEANKESEYNNAVNNILTDS